MDRLEELRGDEESSGNVPSVLFIAEGEYDGGVMHHSSGYVTMKKPLSIYGAGREKTTLVGVGLKIEVGHQSGGIVEIEDLKIQGGKGEGLWARRLNPLLGVKMNVIMRGCSVEDCQREGVLADGVDVTCGDLQVVGCGMSGVCADSNATITLSGQSTSIEGNVRKGYSYHYGLKTSSWTKIQLVVPLTKEQISTNNDGGGNWGGKGTIEQVSK